MRLSEKINGSFTSLFESSYNQSLNESYEVWQKYYEDGKTTTEFVQSFEDYEKAQKFADGLNKDPDCEAWVKTLNESEEYTFQEIIDMMEMAEDYAELKNAASFIKNEKLRKAVEEEIQQCYIDNDSVETAYSIVTSDLLDMRAYDDNVEILKETTNRGIKEKREDLYARTRQKLKDAGDPKWENLVSLRGRLSDEDLEAYEKEYAEISTIEMIHSILTYTPKENWNVDYVMNDKYMKSYINELGEDKVKELAQQEIDEYINNATVEQGTYTDSEGVTYNSTTFKNESECLKVNKYSKKLTEESVGETWDKEHDKYLKDMDKRFTTFCKNMEIDKNNLDEVLWALDELEGQFGDEDGEYQKLREFIYNELMESEKLTEGTSQKRIARFGEFDNGHVLHSYYKMTDEEAEEKAKQASIENPHDVYYVSYDDIMNPNSGVYWYKGKSYSNEEIIEIRKKEKENIKIKESNSLSKDEILSRIFARYPDISKEDEDYLNGLPLDGLINEVYDRGWDEVLNESEKLSDSDKEILAKEVFDWYNNDMGNYFDEIKGNEKEVYDGILAVIETNDEDSINLFIKDIENVGLDEDKDLIEKLKNYINKDE